jgi:hypothetical protein
MFDPIFALIFLSITLLLTTAITFAIAKFFLPSRSLWKIALAAAIAGHIGFYGSANLLGDFATLYWMDLRPMERVGICFGTAILTASLVGWIVWRMTRDRTSN